MNNLIGVSGKINSGKDLIGEIIQYFAASPGQSFEQWKFVQALAPYSPYKIKKFADKLKDIVCLLIGCTREQLEDREFKESTLGKEWNYYFAKDLLQVELYSFKEYNQLKTNQKTWFEEKQLTPRKLLQLLGTDCGRKIIHPNIWVNALFADYKNEISFPGYSHMENGDYIQTHINVQDVDYPKWIITDVRFPNEVDAIKERGGIVIRVNRPKIKVVTDDLVTDIIHNSKNFGIVEHESETALDQYKEFDHIITNDGTINDLVNKLQKIIKHEN